MTPRSLIHLALILLMFGLSAAPAPAQQQALDPGVFRSDPVLDFDIDGQGQAVS